jgi:imidazolonepropionase-like amidohydrolase
VRAVPALAAALVLAACGLGAPRGLVLVGATVIDGTGAPPLRDAVVVIEGDRITAVGPQSHVPLPKGLRTVDVRGKFLVPIDAASDTEAVAALQERVRAGTDALAAFLEDLRRRQEQRRLGRGGEPRLLKPGAPADLRVLAGDPLADFRHLTGPQQTVLAGVLAPGP